MIGQVEFYEKAGFQNILSERCYEYLVEKETIGVQIQKPMGMLLRFLRMCLANGEPLDYASKSAVECWNEKDINETPRNHYYRATEIRRFMQYLEKAGIDAYVDRDIRRVQSSFVPYIFSHSEIVRLFAAADGLPYCWRKHRYTFPSEQPRRHHCSTTCPWQHPCTARCLLLYNNRKTVL